MAAGDRVRRALLGLFVVGLASSITLSQAALALLALEWLWRCRTAPMLSLIHISEPTRH